MTTKTANEPLYGYLNESPEAIEPPPDPPPITEPITEPIPTPIAEPVKRKRKPRALADSETVVYRCPKDGCHSYGIKTTNLAAKNGGTLPPACRLQNTQRYKPKLDKEGKPTGEKVPEHGCPGCGKRFTIATRHRPERICEVFNGPRHRDAARRLMRALNRAVEEQMEAAEEGRAIDKYWLAGNPCLQTGSPEMLLPNCRAIIGRLHTEGKPPRQLADGTYERTVEAIRADTWGCLK